MNKLLMHLLYFCVFQLRVIKKVFLNYLVFFIIIGLFLYGVPGLISFASWNWGFFTFWNIMLLFRIDIVLSFIGYIFYLFFNWIENKQKDY